MKIQDQKLHLRMDPPDTSCELQARQTGQFRGAIANPGKMPPKWLSYAAEIGH
jgi:hypothetical protein